MRKEVLNFEPYTESNKFKCVSCNRLLRKTTNQVENFYFCPNEMCLNEDGK